MEEATEAWNKGFEGYALNQEMSVEKFIYRLHTEELSPTLSFIAYDQKEPVGIVLNGFRKVDGKMIAWNGGTGVFASYRGKGIGKLLIHHALEIYQQEGANIATLEALIDNYPAIKLYESQGYKMVDVLSIMERKERKNEVCYQGNESHSIPLKNCSPKMLKPSNAVLIFLHGKLNGEAYDKMENYSLLS